MKQGTTACALNALKPEDETQGEAAEMGRTSQ